MAFWLSQRVPRGENLTLDAVFRVESPRRAANAGFQFGKRWPEGGRAIECGAMSETMEPPKKRRFWQLHLSTAVLMMLTTGLLYANVFGRPRLWILEGRNPPEPVIFVHEMGFPFTSYRFMDIAAYADTSKATPENMKEISYGDEYHRQFEKFDTSLCTSDERWLLKGLLLNVSATVMLFLAARFLTNRALESIIRRREGRTP